MKPNYDWSNVDWTQPDAMIAKQLGCSRMAVYKRRNPNSIRTREWKRRARAVLEWLATPDETSDAEEIVRQTDAMVEEARKLTAHGRPEQP